MLVEILIVLLVVVVVVLMAVDLARTRGESQHWHAEGQAYGVKYGATGAVPGSRGEAFLRQPAATGIPAGVPDASSAGHAASISPSAGSDTRLPVGPSAVLKRSRRELKNWHVRSRLLLLVVVSAVTAAVVALCVVGIVGVLRGTAIHSPNGSVHERAVVSALALGVLPVIALALASWCITVTVRSLLRPLRKLRVAVREVAGARLPATVRRLGESDKDGVPFDLEPIDVHSSDEIGEIGRGFDELRREVLRLAIDDPGLHGKLNAMFVSLSHRSQSLAERQMRLLQSLEQGEQNPQRLATLVRVDGIANRMHRNADNLLILADQEPPSRWNQPVALANLISAAVAEVEESQRVSLNALPDIAIVGSAVNDVVHLFAELTENATSFSAADMQVEISGWLLASGGVLLDITDRGVGMTPKELAYANWRLENPSAVEVDAPKWIGLFVVARLAARHGIRVRLQPAESGGLTALVWLPNEVFTQQGPVAAPRPSGFATTKTRRGLHEAEPEPDYATAGRMPATAGFAPPAGNAGNAQLDRRSAVDPRQRSEPAGDIAGGNVGTRPGPPGAGRSDVSQVAAALSGTAVPVSQQASPADRVIVPSAEGLTAKRGLPIFNEVESAWFRSGHGMATSAGASAASGSGWSSPVDSGWRAAEAADSPASDGSTAAGLPKRSPHANLIPGAIPSMEPVMPRRSPAAARERLASLQRGVDKGRSATGRATSPSAAEESQPGSSD